MELKRNIRLFFAAYGKLLFQIIGTVLIILLVIQSLNRRAIEQNNAKEDKAQLTEEEQKELIKEKEQEEQDIKAISKFIDLCIEGNIEEAYDFLSEECKNEKYTTINQFKSNYIDKIFEIKISDYLINKEGEEYTVKLKQDSLVTGKEDNFIITKYLIKQEILTPKIDVIE